MTPKEVSDWDWERDAVKEAKGTVGALTWDDLDNDGWNEVWVPDYDNSKMEVFRFRAIEQDQFLQ